MLITNILSLKSFQREDYKKLNMSECSSDGCYRYQVISNSSSRPQFTMATFYSTFFHMNLSTAEELHSNTVTVRNVCFTKYYVPRRLPRWTELFADCYFIALWEHFPRVVPGSFSPDLIGSDGERLAVFVLHHPHCVFKHWWTQRLLPANTHTHFRSHFSNLRS